MNTSVPSSSFVLFQALFAWFYFISFFIRKHDPLVGETLIEIESAVAKQTKKCNFVSFKTFCQQQFFTTLKGIFKKYFEFSFGININFIYSNIALNS